MADNWYVDHSDELNALLDRHGVNKDAFYECLSESDGYEEGPNTRRVDAMNEFLEECRIYGLRAVNVRDHSDDELAWQFIETA